VLNLRLLGEIEVLRNGQRMALPPSRKTRALLAYLAATERPHRRDRLCSIFWEIPDDPRGALRWSLSRLRALVDEPNRARISATRDSVAFDPAEAIVDVVSVRKRVAAGFPALPITELEALAAEFRGEFLEGVDLPDAHEFQSWCIAEREDLRRLQARILSSLIGRQMARPEAALAYSRQLVQIDPYNEAARTSLLQILIALGRRSEAERHFETAMRVFSELGNNAEIGLIRTWRKLREAPAPERQGPAVDLESDTDRPRLAAVAGTGDGAPSTLVGRVREMQRLTALLGEMLESGASNIVLLSGEPGLGKSRLMDELADVARTRGVSVFAGQAYETDRGHPFGPWTEAMGVLPTALLPQDEAALGNAGTADDRNAKAGGTRERMFAAVADKLFQAGQPLLLCFDDVQWCDEASVELLQYVVRVGRQRPMMVALAARAGELPDNIPMHVLLRSLRNARRLHEIKLPALAATDIGEIVRMIAPEADPDRVSSQCGGNPLYAIELARSPVELIHDVPRPLKELVRHRTERLPGHAAEALTWASILGPNFSVERLTQVAPLGLEELTQALEVLERHELLVAAANRDASCFYRFAHDLVHRAIYTTLSEPRRRLMHLKAARALKGMSAGDEGLTSEGLAPEVAHHASLAGDGGMAAAACVAAGRRCLRLFANAEAESLARKGLRYAEELTEPERTQRTLELMQVEMLARRPSDPALAIERIEALAERALDYGCLDHARLGYHMLSHLRWERGSWSDAQRDTLRAEFVSRSADETQRVYAMAEASRCLAMLERDLGQAEALVLEANALAQRLAIEPNAIADAIGLLRQHQGEFEEAAAQFRRARDVARRDGDRTSEFLALEHLIVLEIQRGRHREAMALCHGLVALAEKLREGSEAPFGRAVDAVCRLALGDQAMAGQFEAAVSDLRAADAKHRLSLALLCAAEIDIGRGQPDRARTHAAEALELVTILERESDMVWAHSMLARLAGGDAAARERHAMAIRDSLAKPLSRHARMRAEATLAASADRSTHARTRGKSK
jgi:DNA-binding SARP family transcriptional activator